MSIVEDVHVPVIPLSDVVGKGGTLSPAQITSAVPKLNTGVMLGAIETENVTGGAQVLVSGVNV